MISIMNDVMKWHEGAQHMRDFDKQGVKAHYPNATTHNTFLDLCFAKSQLVSEMYTLCLSAIYTSKVLFLIVTRAGTQ